MKIIVNDKNNFYFGREAEILEAVEMLGKILYRVKVGNVTFALDPKDAKII